MRQAEIDFDAAAAHARGLEGMERAAEHAGEEWKRQAIAWLEGYLRTHASYFPDTDNQGGPQPVSPKAWGAVTRYALLKPWIRPTGEYRPRTRGHGSPGAVYESLLFRGQA